MDISIGGITASAPTVEPFHIYAYIKTAVVCPSACGTDASTVVDVYTCEMDGDAADNSVCVTQVIHLPSTQTSCPPTVDCDCQGSWSTCAADCGDKIYRITQDIIGNVGNGVQCPAADGSAGLCASGDSACTDVDCVGAWSSAQCPADCGDRMYSVSTIRILAGTACAADDQDSIICLPGDGNCPLPPIQLDTIALDAQATAAAQTTVTSAIGSMSASADTTVVEIAASITFAGDVTTIADRAAFDTEFKSSMATGIGVSASDIIVDGVAAGSIVVAFHMLAPAAVQTETASLIAAVDTTTIFVTVNGASVAGSGTLVPVVNAAPNVDCAGGWSTCAADCADKIYTISASQSGLGSSCVTAAGASSACAAGVDLCPADVSCVGAWSVITHANLTAT